MASLVLGSIGGYFFGPIGFAIGSAIGSALFDQTKSEGPRLQDKRLQGSSYGEPIARVYGTMVLSGQVIWAPDLTEHKHKTGGKGGPQVTTYTYTGSFTVLVSESNGGAVVAGIQRMWFDGTLMYDTTGATTVDNSLIPATIYLGDESQLPDPTEEAVLGVGNVSAHRGYCRVVYSDWDLGQFGNRIPTIKYQVFTAAGAFPWQVSEGNAWNELNYGVASFEFINGELIITSKKAAPKTARWEKYDLQLNSLEGPIYTTPVDGEDTSAINHNNWIGTPPATSDAFWEVFDDATGNCNQSLDITIDWTAHPPIGNLCAAVGADKEFWFGITGTPAQLVKWGNGGGFLDSAVVGAFNGNTCSLGTSDSSHEIYVCHESSGTSELFLYNITDMTLTTHWDAAALAGTRMTDGTRGNFVVYKGRLAFNYRNGSTDYIAVVDLGPGIAADDPDATLLIQNLGGGRLADLGNGLVMNCNNGVFSLQPPAAPVVLGAIVADQSNICGLVASQYPDLPGSLPDLVPGFMISRQSSGYDNIAQLRGAYLFDAVESSAAMKFVKRGGAPVVSIPDEHLAAQEPGGTPPPLVTVVRTPELELPATMYVNYFNIGADYQTGTQYSRRLVTRSQADARADFAIALDDMTARSISQKLLYMSWLERTKCTILVPRWYAYLEPSDVITAHGYTFRIEHKSNVANDIIQLEGVVTVSSSSSLFYSGSIGVATGGNPTVTPPTPVSSDFQLYDIPLVQDSDYANGVYAAMYPTIAGPWPGGTIYQSNDGGSTYNQVGTDSSQDVIGTVALALGDFLGKNTFDWGNPFTVVLSNGGTLSSATRDAVLNGANGVLVGDELLQYTTATLTAPNTYVLDGLLRGRRGTKDKIATHTTAERFLLLPPTINIAAPFAELGAARLYKGVTTGASLSGAIAKTFTNNGKALECYQPVHLGGGRDASGNITIHWDRCTRIGGAWLNFTDVPVSEPTQDFILTFYTSSSYLTSVISYLWVPMEYTYPTAQQTADFGGLVDPLYWTVQQKGFYGFGKKAYGVT